MAKVARASVSVGRKWEGSAADRRMDKRQGYAEDSPEDNATDRKMQRKMGKAKGKGKTCPTCGQRMA